MAMILLRSYSFSIGFVENLHNHMLQSGGIEHSASKIK